MPANYPCDQCGSRFDPDREVENYDSRRCPKCGNLHDQIGADSSPEPVADGGSSTTSAPTTSVTEATGELPEQALEAWVREVVRDELGQLVKGE